MEQESRDCTDERRREASGVSQSSNADTAARTEAKTRILALTQGQGHVGCPRDGEVRDWFWLWQA